MTQDLLSQPDSDQENSVEQSENIGWGVEETSADFDYTPLSPWGIVAMVLALLGLTAFLGLFGIFVAAIALVVSVAAVIQIRGAQGAVRGIVAALLGLVVSMTSVGGGIASQVYHYRTEVPEGYQRVNFPKDVSDKQFLYHRGIRKLHPDVVPLVGQKIFIKGYMWLSQREENIDRFVLLKDNGECCFGGSPKPYDMMQVNLEGGKRTDGHTGMVSVAGILNVDISAGQDEAVYTLEAQLVEPARTRF